MNLLENISIFDKIYPGMFITVLIILAIMLFACLIRAVKGPRIADRIDGNYGHGHDSSAFPIIKGRLSGRYLSDLCDGKFFGSDCNF